MFDQRVEFLKTMKRLNREFEREFFSLREIKLRMGSKAGRGSELSEVRNLLKDDMMIEQDYLEGYVKYRITHEGYRFLDDPHRYEKNVKNQKHGTIDEGTRKWNKMGVISAIGIGGAALIVSLVSLVGI